MSEAMIAAKRQEQEQTAGADGGSRREQRAGEVGRSRKSFAKSEPTGLLLRSVPADCSCRLLLPTAPALCSCRLLLLSAPDSQNLSSRIRIPMTMKATAAARLIHSSGR